jgi:hypothetical protein
VNKGCLLWENVSSSAGGDREHWNSAKGCTPEREVKQQLSFATLAFLHFYICISLFLPCPLGEVKWCFLRILWTFPKLHPLAYLEGKGTMQIQGCPEWSRPEKGPVASPNRLHSPLTGTDQSPPGAGDVQ